MGAGAGLGEEYEDCCAGAGALKETGAGAGELNETGAGAGAATA